MAVCALLFTASCKKSEGDKVTGGELVVIQGFSDIHLGVYGIDTLNPIATKSKSVQKIMNIIYEPLFTFGESGEAEGVLAESYSVSEEGRQISVRLKSGVKWHDGTNFTAEDVAYTLSRMRDSGGLYGVLSSKIHSFTATDKNTIIINFENSEPSPAHLLTFPVIPRHISYTADENYSPVGTGSYRFASKGGTEIVLEPNARWHEGEVSERKVIVKILKDQNALIEAFNVGEIDAITSDELLKSTMTPKTNSISKVMVSDKMVFLGFNTKSPAVSLTVRKAIASLLDRKKIVEQGAYGRGIPTEISIDPESFAVKNDRKKQNENFEDIMENGGYSVKDGVYAKGDEKVKLRLLVNSDNAERLTIAENILSTLKTADFDATLEKASYDDYISRIGSDSFDMFIGETTVSMNLNPAAMLTSSDNYFNMDTFSINSKMANIYSVTDKKELKEKIGDFITLFYDDPPYIPLYFKTEDVIYGAYVSGIEKPFIFNPYKNIEKWYFYEKEGKENKEQADE